MDTRELKTVTVVEKSEPGAIVARVCQIDPSIIIDDYMPSEPSLVWICDHCDTAHPVTAQFKVSKTRHLTLCRHCLELAINGIDHSLAHPTTLDEPAQSSP